MKTSPLRCSSRRIAQKFWMFLICFALPAALPVQASLLIDPAGGSSITPSNPDDGSASRNLGGVFDFYGTPVTNVYLQVNGFLSLADSQGLYLDRSITGLAQSASSSVIAGLYDDQIMGPGSLLSDLSTSSYYAATWQNLFGVQDPSGGTSTFQILLLLNDSTIGGYSFQAGDIAISYGGLGHATDGTITVGVAQNGSNGTGTPFSADGQMTDLSLLPSGNEFLLYRPNQSGGYDVSVASAVPEPSSLALMGCGLIGLATYARRKRSQA